MGAADEMTKHERSGRIVGGRSALALAATFSIISALTATAATVVGGLTPSVRPAGAPAVTTFDNGDKYLRFARRGISEPYPSSLGFLADQGAWYTPFTHRGMPGRYDIRGLHGMPATLSANKAAK